MLHSTEMTRRLMARRLAVVMLNDTAALQWNRKNRVIIQRSYHRINANGSSHWTFITGCDCNIIRAHAYMCCYRFMFVLCFHLLHFIKLPLIVAAMSYLSIPLCRVVFSSATFLIYNVFFCSRHHYYTPFEVNKYRCPILHTIKIVYETQFH